MQNTFDGVRVSGRSKTRKKLTIPLVSASDPSRKVSLEITTVEGYPYLPPHVKLVFPHGLRPGDKHALSEYEIEQMRKEVNDNIQPCLSSGMPCLMQIAMTVAMIVDSGCSAPPTPTVKPAGSGAGRAGMTATSTPGQSPALTPVPLKAKDALRLSLLTLHVLRKCCNMKNPESKEEANSDFKWIARYLFDTAKVFPPAACSALPWRGEPFVRAFEGELKATARQEMLPVHPAADMARTDLMKWLWESEELPVKLQQGTEGRYQNEFIQQRILGAGGFAPVYVCRKKIDGRLYAIKKVVMAEMQSEKIIREVQTLAALNHKNIVRYYDAWVEDGCEEELKQFIDDEDDEEDEEDHENNAGDDDNDDSSSHNSRTPTSGSTAGPLKMKQGPTTTRRGQAATHASSEKEPRRNKYGLMWFSSSSSSEDDDDDDDESSDNESSCDNSEDTGSSDGSGDSRDDHDRPDCNGKSNLGGPALTKEPTRKVDQRNARAYQTLYIQMELCSARSLRHLIEEGDEAGGKGIFSSEGGEKVAAAILRQLLTVTAHTHRENIVHRDLKPDNVLFEMNQDYADGEIGTIRVADFGLARVMSGVKRNGSHLELTDATGKHKVAGPMPTGNCGSVLYCAPEQEKGSNYGFKVDEFSIGMIALEMWLTIAGKGFRDRFTIMNEVWRSGQLPGWFVTWNPPMAQVIGVLLELDQQARRSCEEVLATADLPGDPADLIEAMETIDRYGERIVPRVMQRMQRLSNQYMKPPPTIRDTAQVLGTPHTADFNLAVGIVGLLHGSAAVSLYDSLILMNPSLSDIGLEGLVDGSGRSYCHSPWPQFAITAFLGMQENLTIGPLHAFYHKARSFAIFASPLKRADAINEALLEPVLSLLHLLSLVDITSPVEIVISHADWLSAVFPREVGSRAAPPGLLALRTVMDTPEKVSLAVSQVSEALAAEGLPVVDERDDFVRKFASAVMEAIHFFARAVASHVSVVLDPAFVPSDSLVCRGSLSKGILFECRAGPRLAAAIAFGCTMDNFAPLCTVLSTDVSGLCVAVDAAEFCACWKHVRLPGKEGIVLDGVAIKRHDQYSISQLAAVVEAAAKLWKGGVKGVLCMESDPHALGRVVKSKHLRHILIDGKRLVPASARQHNKMVSKQPDVPLDKLCQTIRELARTSRDPAAQAADVEVIFITDHDDRRVREEAREVFAAMASQVKGPILVVHADAAEVDRYLHDLGEQAEPQGSGGLLQQYLRSNAGTLGVVPIFAAKDAKMLLYVNQKKFTSQRKKDNQSGNKKKK